MIVVIVEEAQADLIEIGDFIGHHNPKRAATFVEELFSCCEKLADMPLGYPLSGT